LLSDSGREVGPLQGLLREQITDEARSLEGREYIHLLDGGLSDNLGLLNGLGALVMIGDHREAMRAFGYEDVELILVITVNAEVETERPWDGLDKPATPINVVSGLTGAQMEQVNRMTIKLAQRAFAELASELSTPEREVRFQHAELSFAKIPDEDERRFLRRIETSFSLSDEKVDRLIHAARQLVRDSKEIDEALAPFREGVPQP
jgi:NTE family protein